jgi:hypothetical protein
VGFESTVHGDSVCLLELKGEEECNGLWGLGTIYVMNVF